VRPNAIGHRLRWRVEHPSASPLCARAVDRQVLRATSGELHRGQGLAPAATPCSAPGLGCAGGCPCRLCRELRVLDLCNVSAGGYCCDGPLCKSGTRYGRSNRPKYSKFRRRNRQRRTFNPLAILMTRISTVATSTPTPWPENAAADMRGDGQALRAMLWTARLRLSA
jgi:hypothetical protein